MSAPNDKGNPWLSVGDLLKNEVPVSTLATAIEKYGIKTYDRFGRRIAATDKDNNDVTSKAFILDLLAKYYDIQDQPHNEEEMHHLFDFWDSPIYRFGWPKNEQPDFDEIPVEESPQKPNQQTRFDTPYGSKIERTYQVIIGAMLELMLGKSKGGQSHSIFKNQSAIIDALVSHYPGKPGISKRTLEEKFAAAKRELK